MNNTEKLTLALAGMAQAVSLVNDLALHGHCEPAAYAASINSILKINSASVSEVFGSTEGVRYGLVQLERFLGSTAQDFPKQSVRYFMALTHLERKLANDKTTGDLLKTRLDFAVKQSEFFPPLDSVLINSLASVYSDTIAMFTPRIMVFGKEAYLATDDIATKIRALLLAGIRATVLWRQLGGSRIKLIFQRKSILAAIKALRGV